MAPLSVISLSGNAFEQGLTYGRIEQEKILKAIHFYSGMFEGMAGISWEKAKSISSSFLPAIQDYYPEALDEMRGISQGANLCFEDILTLNCRSEVLFAQPDGCSCIGLLPEQSTDGHVYLGQTWDWLRKSGEHISIVKIQQDHGPDILMVVEAGVIGGKGLNSNGIGVGLNCTSVSKGQIGVPLHIMFRTILNATTISNGLDYIAKAKRAGAGTFNLGSSEGFLMSVEYTPDNFDVLMAENSPLCHTNHYQSPLFKDQDTFKVELTDTFVRLNRMRRLCQAHTEKYDRTFLMSVLSDHANYPDSICSHEDPADPPFKQLCTVYSMMMDLTERTLWITPNNPCEGHEIKISLY